MRRHHPNPSLLPCLSLVILLGCLMGACYCSALGGSITAWHDKIWCGYRSPSFREPTVLGTRDLSLKETVNRDQVEAKVASRQGDRVRALSLVVMYQ